MVWVALIVLALPQVIFAEKNAAAAQPGPSSGSLSPSGTVDYTSTIQRVRKEMSSGSAVWPQEAVRKPEGARSRGLPTAPEPSRETATPVLVETAQSEDIATRLEGLEGLAQAGGIEHVDTFVAALADPASEIREAAAAILSRLDPGVVTDKVIESLCSDKDVTVVRIDTVLPMMKDALEPGMIRALRSEDESSLRRQAAAYALGRMNSTAAAQALAAHVYESDPGLAVACANALMALNDPMLTPTLANLARHPIPQIRWPAVQCLADLGGPEALDALGRVAIDPPEGDEELGRQAVVLLGETRADAAIPVLIEIMRRNLGLRRAAVEALHKRTGEDLGDRPSDWQAWYEARLQAPPPEEQMLDAFGPLPFDVEYLP